MDSGAFAMSGPWLLFEDELSRWRDVGRGVDFWWRDDDATQPVPALIRLTALAAQAEVPLGLAVVPEAAEPGLFDELGAEVEILQHGFDHRNRAAKGEKASEYPAAEARESAVLRLAGGRARLQVLAGGRLLPVLVPPWNRFP